MSEQQQDQLPSEQSEAEQTTPMASGGYQTPIDESIRKTGAAEQIDAKPTAVQESGSSDPLTEGGGNQGTEKR
jgi:photosystem I subunit 4